MIDWLCNITRLQPHELRIVSNIRPGPTMGCNRLNGDWTNLKEKIHLNFKPLGRPCRILDNYSLVCGCIKKPVERSSLINI